MGGTAGQPFIPILNYNCPYGHMHHVYFCLLYYVYMNKSMYSESGGKKTKKVDKNCLKRSDESLEVRRKFDGSQKEV